MISNTKIKFGLINFTNCMPLNYTLERWQREDIELIYGNPAQINELMAKGELDIAPVSSIEYLKNEDKYKLIETACISSDGECGSVILFSNKELNEIKKIGLPCDSASSVAMLKILMKQNDISYIEHNYKNISSDADAVLFIGDNALKEKHLGQNYKFSYDLGRMWKQETGLPAVFGTWVKSGDKIIQMDYLVAEAIETGLRLYFNKILDNASKKLNLQKEIIKDYLTAKIKYSFTERHKASLETFKKSYISCFSGNNNPDTSRLYL